MKTADFPLFLERGTKTLFFCVISFSAVLLPFPVKGFALTVVDLLVLLMMVFFLMANFSLRKLRDFVLSFLVVTLLFFLTAFLAGFTGNVTGDSLKDLIKLTEYLFCVYLLAAVYPVNRHPRYYGAAFISAAAVIVAGFTYNFYKDIPVTFMNGFFPHYNLCGMYICLLIILLLYSASFYRTKFKTAILITAGALLLFVTNPITKGLLIVFIVGILLGTKFLPRKTAAFAASILLVVIHLLFIRFASPRYYSYCKSALSPVDGKNEIKQQYLEAYAAFSHLIEKKGLGSGLGNYQASIDEFYYHLPKLNTMEPFTQNQLLILAVETGLCGLLVYLLFFIIPLQRYRQQGTGNDNGKILIFGLCTLLLLHFSGPVLTKGTGLLLAIILAQANRDHGSSDKIVLVSG